MPPERPGDNECCGSGCDPCIFDYFYQEMDRYREELRAWEARQAAREAAGEAAHQPAHQAEDSAS